MKPAVNGYVRAVTTVPFDQVVVVIPAHNEARRLPRCVDSVSTAAAQLAAPVLTVCVLDACDDSSDRLTARFAAEGVHIVAIDARNVGAARAAGFAHARSACGVVDESRVWYANTDADSRVDVDWLVRQTVAGADMVLGVVRVARWHRLWNAGIRRYLSVYRSKPAPAGSEHGHVHGANMGFAADVYWRAGGFAPLTSGEDVDMVRRFEELGARIRRDAGLSVQTSARRAGRAPGGFAAHLRAIDHFVVAGRR